MKPSRPRKTLPVWYSLAGVFLTGVTLILLLCLFLVLQRDGVIVGIQNFGLGVVLSYTVLMPIQYEVHERLHWWGFVRAGVPRDKVKILRAPLWRTLLSLEGLGGDPRRRWCVVVTCPVDARTFRQGTLAALWILIPGALAGGLAFGLLDRVSWPLSSLLGAAFGAAYVGLGTVHDVYQFAWSRSRPPGTLFRVNFEYDSDPRPNVQRR